MLCPCRVAMCMDGFVGSLHILLQTALNDVESPDIISLGYKG